MIIVEIHKTLAIKFIQRHHYSPVMPKLTKHYLGFYENENLVGALSLGWGTQPRQTIHKMFSNLTTKDYYEIGKMCMTDEMPRNSESQMLSLTIKWLKKNHPHLLFLYTMADGIMGKCGYVYQASNFLYGGSYYTQVYMMENGEKLHPRSAKLLLQENAILHSKSKMFWLTSDYMVQNNIRFIEGMMFRYIYPLNKKAKKLLNSSSMNWTNAYPKDKDLLWYDKTNRPKKQIDKPPFTFVDVVYNRKNVGEISNNLEEFFA